MTEPGWIDDLDREIKQMVAVDPEADLVDRIRERVARTPRQKSRPLAWILAAAVAVASLIIVSIRMTRQPDFPSPLFREGPQPVISALPDDASPPPALPRRTKRAVVHPNLPIAAATDSIIVSDMRPIMEILLTPIPPLQPIIIQPLKLQAGLGIK